MKTCKTCTHARGSANRQDFICFAIRGEQYYNAGLSLAFVDQLFEDEDTEYLWVSPDFGCVMHEEKSNE